MRLRTLATLFLLFFYITYLDTVQAQNNKFGAHIAVPSDEDIQKTAELVNSNGGSYGYITMVIQENNKDVGYWQGIFEKLREKKLIPIIRIATQGEGHNWRVPNPEDAAVWADFLSKLEWVTKNRYVMLFNETNHGNEWGGVVDPASYGRIAAKFAEELKNKSADFKILLAGMDLAAPQKPPSHMDAYTYLQESSKSFCDAFLSVQKQCADYIDYISSHSYPNPGFRGSPYDSAKNSIRGYNYEIEWYKTFFGKEYPVMITETGWDAHKVGQGQTAQNYTIAFRELWLQDLRVHAVTPFILNYQSEPFLQFSLLSQGSAQPLESYIAIQSLPKTKGNPEIIDTAKISFAIPQKLVEESVYELPVQVKNTGQRIWEDGEYVLSLVQDGAEKIDIQIIPALIGTVRPHQEWNGKIFLRTGSAAIVSRGLIYLTLQRDQQHIAATEPQDVYMSKQPSLQLNVALFAKGLSTSDGFEVQIFDENERLVFQKKDQKIILGRGHVPRIKNIIPGQRYRVVLLKQYYLPRQEYVDLVTGENKVTFEKMMPLDFDQNGALSINDIGALFQRTGDGLGFGEKVKLLLPN